MESAIKEKFQKLLYHLDEAQVLDLNSKHGTVELNNVLTGLNSECFGILVGDVPNKIVYQLFYVNGRKLPVGHLLDLDFEDSDRNQLVFLFAGYLSQKYPDLELIDAFNTYQQQTRSMLEKMRHLTMSSTFANKFKDQNPSIITKDVTGFSIIPFIDKVEFYRDYFGNRHSITTEEGLNYVYVMLNKRNNLFKIGTSTRPRFRERTLQSQEPEIAILTYWCAPREIERGCKNSFSKRRKEVNGLH